LPIILYSLFSEHPNPKTPFSEYFDNYEEKSN